MRRFVSCRPKQDESRECQAIVAEAESQLTTRRARSRIHRKQRGNCRRARQVDGCRAEAAAGIRRQTGAGKGDLAGKSGCAGHVDRRGHGLTRVHCQRCVAAIWREGKGSVHHQVERCGGSLRAGIPGKRVWLHLSAGHKLR